MVMGFYTRIESKYSVKERIQTLTRSKPADLEEPTSLVGYSFPPTTWIKLVEKIATYLESRGIVAELPRSKDPHVSIAIVSKLTPEEKAKIVHAGDFLKTKYTPHGVDILKGRDGKTFYLSLAMDVAEGHRKFFNWLRNFLGKDRVGDYRNFLIDHKPHTSLLTLKSGGLSAEIMKDLEGIVKSTAGSFKPDYTMIFDNFAPTLVRGAVL